MDQPIGEAGVEDDRQPASRRDELALRIDRVAGGRVHPAVGGKDPEGRKQSAERDHQRGEEMEPLPDALQAEQHHSQKPGFEEKRRQYP